MTKLTHILSEITINNPQNNKSLLKKMVEYDETIDGSYIDSFNHYDTFEEWYDDNDDSDDETINLAKKFFEWRKHGDIQYIEISDDDIDSSFTLLKAYKKAITYGLGYSNSVIILHNF